MSANYPVRSAQLRGLARCREARGCHAGLDWVQLLACLHRRINQGQRLKQRRSLRLLTGLLAPLLVSALCEARHREPAPGQPEIRSSSVLVLDEGSSTVLLARQVDQSTPIASITKLMTALVVLDAQQPLDEMLGVSEAGRERGRGAFSRLGVGTRLSRGDLFHLPPIPSETRPAHLLPPNH